MIELKSECGLTPHPEHATSKPVALLTTWK